MASTENVAIPNTFSTVQRFAERRYWPQVALILLTVVTFAMTVSFGFVYDDRHSIMNLPGIHSTEDIASCFTVDIAAAHGSNLYRPVSCVVQKAGSVVLDKEPGGWHVLSLLLHVLNVLLVFRLAKLLLRDGFTSLTAAALFAVHPIHIEPVAWVSAIADPLMTVFLLAAGVMWYRWAQKGRGWWLLGALAAGATGLLCKEPAIVLPVLLPVTALANARERRRSSAQLLVGALPFVVVDIAYLLARHSVIKTAITHAGAVPTTTAQMICALPSVLWFHLRQLVVPMEISLSYPLGPQQTWAGSGFFLPLFSIVAVAVLVAWLISLSERRVQLCVALAWMVLPLAPLLYLKAFANFEFVHDRFLYAPSIGFCMLAAVALVAVGKLLAVRNEEAQVAVPGAVVVIAAVWTLVNLPVFRNDVEVFKRAVSVAPENPAMVLDYGTVLLEQKDYAHGIPIIERAIELRPTDPKPIFNRGRAAWELGDNLTAERYFVRAIQLRELPEYLVQFVSVEMRLGKLADAEAAAREALRLDPRVANGHLALGAVLLQRGDRSGAIEEFKQQLALDPTNRGAQIGLQRLTEK